MRRNFEPNERGQAIVIILILLALAAGAVWYAIHSRAEKEKAARAFASDAAHRIILRGESRLLDVSLSRQAQITYPPSWRERLFRYIQAQGHPLGEIRVTGGVSFSDYFLEPRGRFRAAIDYSNGPAYLDLEFSHPGFRWEIDAINWVWSRAPEPSPSPSLTPTVTPTPIPVVPTPEPTKRKRR